MRMRKMGMGQTSGGYYDSNNGRYIFDDDAYNNPLTQVRGLSSIFNRRYQRSWDLLITGMTMLMTS
jgi:hypothetical protein